MSGWLRKMRAHWWFIHKFGPISYVQYENVRRAREKETGEKFDPKKHGERMLRAIGATDAEIAKARAKGLA